MSLLLVVYLIGLLNPLGNFFFGIALVSSLATFVVLLWYMYETERSEIRTKLLKVFTIISIMCFLITAIIPSQQTGYMMMGAYVGEELVKSKTTEKLVDGTSEILGKVNIIVNQKLDEYIQQDKKEVKNVKN